MTPDHALYVGAVAGIALRHGLDVVPRVDVATGDYLPELELTIAAGVTVTLIVPPPPDGWSLATWLAEAT